MFVLSKIASQEDPDGVSVTIKIPSKGQTVDELLLYFADFLSACGFAKYAFEVIHETRFKEERCKHSSRTNSKHFET